MSKQPEAEELFDAMQAPRRRRYSGLTIGGSVAVVLDPRALQDHDIDTEDPPEFEQWVFDERGKIIIDLEQ